MPGSRRGGRVLRPLELSSRMAPTDALFWYAEAVLPEFRPIIAGLFVLDRAPDRRGIEAATEVALSLVPRLRQRVVEAPLQLGLPQWLEDEHFDPAYHLRHLSLPAPGSQRQLLDLVATLFATPLDRQRPLWESYWIDGLEDGRSAYLLKVHHCVVDGVGAIAILDALTVRDPGEPPPRVGPARRHRAAGVGSLGARLTELAREQVATSVHIARRVLEAPLAAAAHPWEATEAAIRIARGLRGVLADTVRAPVRDPLAVQGSGLSRRLDVVDIPLERLRKIKAPLGVSINDLVLAALAGALRGYHRERHVHARELVCMVPMNLRDRHQHDSLGNRVGMFNISLPVGEPRADRRLARVVEQTHAAKTDRRGAAAPILVEALTLLPGAALRWMARSAIGRVNVACTNVPGVPEPRWMGGARVDAIYPFASVVEGTPLVVALLSYAGRMHIGVDTDPEAIPDPHRITGHFEESLDELDRISVGGATG